MFLKNVFSKKKKMYKLIIRIINAIIRRVKIGFEKINGLDFTKKVMVEDLGFTDDIAKAYAPTPEYDLFNVLKHLNIQPAHSILDYGSGKGAAMVTMAKYKFNLVGGVELSLPLIEICKRNLFMLGLKKVVLFHCEASQLKEIDQFTHFYLFNPFPANILELVIQNIKESYHKKPREITLIYYCPRHRDIIDNLIFFDGVKEFKGMYWDTVVYIKEFSD